MGWMVVIHLRLTGTRFCILHFRMNHCDVHLMVTSRVIASNNFQMTWKGKMANIRQFLFGMNIVCLFVYSFFIEGNSTSVTSTAFQAGPHFTENNIYIIIIQYIQYFTIYMIVNLIHDIKNRFFLDENYKTIIIKFVEFLI